MLPRRYARHYYDLFMMSQSPIKQSAFLRKELLQKDIFFKSKFYYSRNAAYETASISDIVLTPPPRLLPEIQTDYERMKNMIYGVKPEFDVLMSSIKELEKEIHRLEP